MQKSKFRVVSCSLLAVLLSACNGTGDSLPQTSEDGLSRVDTRQVDAAYVNPAADFSQYDEVYIANVEVAFKANWLRDQNRDRSLSSSRVTQKDADNIKASMATEFTRIFSEELEKGGYQVVAEPSMATDSERLLELVPAIVDLDVTAPDTRSPGVSRTFTTSAGSMTLNLELHDALSGELLGRITDKQQARDTAGTYVTFSNSVTNKAEADRMLRRWATQLVTRLDKVHGR